MKNLTLEIMIIMLIFSVGCNKNENIYFNGKINLIELPKNSDYLKGELIELEGIYTGRFIAYDSLILFFSAKFPKQLMSAFNLQSKKHVGYFCDKGHGPNDFFEVEICNLLIKNNQLFLWLHGFNEQKMALLNITQSINTQLTKYDSIFNHEWRNKFIMPSIFTFALEDNKILAKWQTNPVFFPNKPPRAVSNYFLIDKSKNDTISYIIHNKPILKEWIFSACFFSSVDKIKPDNKKIAMCMEFMSQLNILNIETGDLIGIRHKNTPDYKYFEKEQEIYRWYYSHLSVDNDFIYGLYRNLIINENFFNHDFSTNEIHIYDWDGNLIRRVFLDKKVDQITLDLNSKNKILYAYSNENEELYAYDVSAYYKK